MIKKCIGCGSVLQTDNINELGYVDNLDKDICLRCFKIKYYGEYKEVTLTNDDYEKIIKSIPKDNLVIYITSVLNVNLDYINNFKNVIIVLTKKDLLPKSVKDNKLINYIKNITDNYIDIEVISSIKNYNLDNLLNKIKKYSKNKKVYFIGMTNSGKSTLINKLIKNYSDSNIEITTSPYPATTLNMIELNVGNERIIDTPGLISNKSILNYLDQKDIKRITPKKEIKPRTYQLKGQGSLLIDKYIRINYYANNNVTIYLANNLKITKISLSNNNLNKGLKKEFDLLSNNDIVVEDLCFAKFTNQAKIEIISLYDLNIYTRDNLI